MDGGGRRRGRHEHRRPAHGGARGKDRRGGHGRCEHGGGSDSPHVHATYLRGSVRRRRPLHSSRPGGGEPGTGPRPVAGPGHAARAAANDPPGPARTRRRGLRHSGHPPGLPALLPAERLRGRRGHHPPDGPAPAPPRRPVDPPDPVHKPDRPGRKGRRTPLQRRPDHRPAPRARRRPGSLTAGPPQTAARNPDRRVSRGTDRPAHHRADHRIGPRVHLHPRHRSRSRRPGSHGGAHAPGDAGPGAHVDRSDSLALRGLAHGQALRRLRGGAVLGHRHALQPGDRPGRLRLRYTRPRGQCRRRRIHSPVRHGVPRGLDRGRGGHRHECRTPPP